MDLTGEEISVLSGLLARATEPATLTDRSWETARMDPVSTVLTAHQPMKVHAGSDEWVCGCNAQRYVSRSHVVITHIRPLVEKAATQKVRGILERAGMDLDVMMKTDKIFGDPQPRYCAHGNNMNSTCMKCARYPGPRP